MDKMTDAQFEERYATQLGKRFLGLEKRLPKSVDYYQWIKARQRLAPIERLTTPYLRLRYYFTLERPLRAVYWRRKKGKVINTADAMRYFRGIK